MILRALFVATLVLVIGLTSFSIFRDKSADLGTNEPPTQVEHNVRAIPEAPNEQSPAFFQDREDDAAGEPEPISHLPGQREQTVDFDDATTTRDSIEQMRRANSMGWPANIESMLYEHISRQGLEFVSIDSVSCDEMDCVIEFTGAPGRDLEYYEKLEDTVYFEPWNVGSASFGGVKTAPGIKRFGLRLSNVRMTPDLLQRLRDKATEAANPGVD